MVSLKIIKVKIYFPFASRTNSSFFIEEILFLIALDAAILQEVGKTQEWQPEHDVGRPVAACSRGADKNLCNLTKSRLHMPEAVLLRGAHPCRILMCEGVYPNGGN